MIQRLAVPAIAALVAFSPSTLHADPPTAPTLQAPSGAGIDATPTYSWNAVAGAEDYYLWVNNTAGVPVLQSWYAATQACSGETCSVTPAVSLERGDHTWWVQARNASGTGPWSAGMGFTVGNLPGAPTLTSPSGPGQSTTPTYSWNAVADADDYYLWVNNAAGVAVVQSWHSAASACSAATCSVTDATPLARGYHTWWIQARNGSGTGPWSAGMGFTVGSVPAALTLVAPSGTGQSATPAYAWNAVADTTEYQLWVNDTVGNPVVQAWYQASSACSGATCTVVPSLTLTQGNHTWWVQGRNASGEGPWSSGMTFVVGDIPTAPILVSPSGTGISTGPSYIWNALPGATQYYLWVNDSAGPVIQDWLDAGAACAGEVCTATSGTALNRGPHTWWVQARNASGDGPWSAGMSFVVGQPPSAPILVSPNGVGASQAPTYTWEATPDTTDYYLWVNGSSGPVIQAWLSAATACAGLQCTATPSTTLSRGAHTWWVQGKNASGEGPWSAGMSFVVGNLPGVPSLISPAGPTSTSSPTFVWTGIEDATEYYLWINNAAGVPVVRRWLDATAVCAGTDCSAPLGQALPGGSYTWWVQARNASGDGAWSAGLSFALTALGGVAAGESHSLATKPDGGLWTWGGNGSGQLGIGSTAYSALPVTVNGLPAITRPPAVSTTATAKAAMAKRASVKRASRRTNGPSPLS